MTNTLWLMAAGTAALAALVWLLRTALRPRVRMPVQYTKHVLERMELREVTRKQVESVLARPARTKPDSARDSVRLERDFPEDVVPRVIGRAGKKIEAIRETTGAKIIVGDDGSIRINAGEREPVDKARAEIEAIMAQPTTRVGGRYLGTVVKTAPHGAFVELPTGNEGMLPIATLRPLAGGRRIEDIADVVKVGDQLQVVVTAFRNGRARLTLC